MAVAARDRLEDEVIGTAVVSMPCWELFDAQDGNHRATVLGPGGTHVAIEAAVRLGWDRYIGEHGRFVGMRGFGSATGAFAFNSRDP